MGVCRECGEWDFMSWLQGIIRSAVVATCDVLESHVLQTAIQVLCYIQFR